MGIAVKWLSEFVVCDTLKENGFAEMQPSLKASCRVLHSLILGILKSLQRILKGFSRDFRDKI